MKTSPIQHLHGLKGESNMMKKGRKFTTAHTVGFDLLDNT